MLIEFVIVTAGDLIIVSLFDMLCG